jgi:hypothetical protein
VKFNIAVAVYTYDRTDDARINFEIIRGIWEKSKLFNKILLIHTYNGKKEWYPNTYLEDKLIRIDNRGHFFGAADLIESGINLVSEKYKDIDYIVTIAADTWLLNVEFLHSVIENMYLNNKYVAASSWGNPFKSNEDVTKTGISTDLFIVNRKWALDYKLFPLKFDEFYKRYYEVLAFMRIVIYVEKIFSLRFLESAQKYFGNSISDHELTNKKDELLYRIAEREPVHNYYSDLIYRPNAPYLVKLKRLLNIESYGYRNMYWPSIELLTHHDLITKQKHLRNHNYPDMEYTKKFINANNLDYFNKH